MTRVENDALETDPALATEQSSAISAPMDASSILVTLPSTPGDDNGASSTVVAAPQSSIATWMEIAAHDDTELVRSWRESPFAVGLTPPTWAGENARGWDALRHCTPLALTGCCCPCADRVGNMVVLSQRMELYQDPVTRTSIRRPRLRLVLGPYWMVLIFVTIPIFSLLSIYTSYSRISNESTLVFSLMIIINYCLFFSLIMVGCTDPGILYRHAAPPPDAVGDNEWPWNDQALTYRPRHAKYDPECAAVIEHFDHTCPWTGTAIGKNNICWFRWFVVFAVMDLLFNVMLIILL